MPVHHAAEECLGLRIKKPQGVWNGGATIGLLYTVAIRLRRCWFRFMVWSFRLPRNWKGVVMTEAEAALDQELRFHTRLYRPGTVVDIGAHTGVFSSAMAALPG